MMTLLQVHPFLMFVGYIFISGQGMEMEQPSDKHLDPCVMSSFLDFFFRFSDETHYN